MISNAKRFLYGCVRVCSSAVINNNSDNKKKKRGGEERLLRANIEARNLTAQVNNNSKIFLNIPSYTFSTLGMYGMNVCLHFR